MRVLYIHYDTELEIPDNAQLGDRLTGTAEFKVTELGCTLNDNGSTEKTAEVLVEISNVKGAA